MKSKHNAYFFKNMILNVSSRTDIIGFYSKWFINRYNEGYIDVRNPFNPKMISRINFNNVDLIFFCTKNPIPILEYLDIIKKPMIFHVTITPYNKDIEPNIPNKQDIINAVIKISKKIGINNIAVRYDPIFISDKYNIDYHIRAFKKLCAYLNGYINKIIVSFIDNYKNVQKNKNILNYKNFTEEIYKKLGINFSKIAHENNMTIQTCYEDNNLCEYGFDKGECLSHEYAYILTGKKYSNYRLRKGNKCNCVQMVDIGVYNSCKHFCKYCYANYDETEVLKNNSNHDPNSSLLIGHINNDDIIKEKLK